LEVEAISASQVRLTWQLNNQARDYYNVRVYRANPLTPQYFEFITALGITATTYVDSGLKANTSYNYQIRFQGKKITMLSAPSNVATAVTMDPNSESGAPISIDVPRYTTQDPGIQSAIKTLSAKAIASNQIELRWG